MNQTKRLQLFPHPISLQSQYRSHSHSPYDHNVHQRSFHQHDRHKRWYQRPVSYSWSAPVHNSQAVSVSSLLLFFFGFSGATDGTQRFPWNFRVFYEKTSASPVGEKFFGGFGCTWLETLPKKTWGMHFSATPSYTLSYHHPSWNPQPSSYSQWFFFQLSTLNRKKSRVKNLQSLSLNTPPPPKKKGSFQHVSTPPLMLLLTDPHPQPLWGRRKTVVCPTLAKFLSRRWEGALDVVTYWWKMFSSY